MFGMFLFILQNYFLKKTVDIQLSGKAKLSPRRSRETTVPQGNMDRLPQAFSVPKKIVGKVYFEKIRKVKYHIRTEIGRAHV